MSFLFFYFPKAACSLPRPGLHTRNSRAQHNLYICTCCTVHTLFASYSLFSRGTPDTSSSSWSSYCQWYRKHRDTGDLVHHFPCRARARDAFPDTNEKNYECLAQHLEKQPTLVSLARHSFRVDFSSQDEGILHQQVDDIVEESQQAAILRQLYVAASCICWH